MTIHSDFFKLAKEGCGQAFTEAAPKRPDVVFIDGQVKLMKADAIDSWPLFFRIQFFRTIEKSFALGAHTVVLGFDNYDHVPSAKAMTQAKRCKHKVNYECAQSSCLPAKIPEDWGSAMANRTFKVKVVCKVLEATTAWFEQKLKEDPLYANLSLVLDHRGVPSVLGSSSLVRDFVHSREWSTTEHTVGRGECDIKAYTWQHMAQCLCIVSVDGDYLPLSLLQTLEPNSCDVLLYRMLTRTKTEPAKRKSTYENDTSRPPPRAYEFVDIAPLKAWLTVVFPSKVVHPVRQFCAMVALCGCDFARNLPRLGPRSLWKIRHRLQNVDLGNPTHALCGINVAYHDMFVCRNVMPTHMSNSIEWFENVSEETALTLYDAMTRKIEQDQRISQRIKQQLWPAATSSVRRVHHLPRSRGCRLACGAVGWGWLPTVYRHRMPQLHKLRLRRRVGKDAVQRDEGPRVCLHHARAALRSGRVRRQPLAHL